MRTSCRLQGRCPPSRPSRSPERPEPPPPASSASRSPTGRRRVEPKSTKIWRFLSFLENWWNLKFLKINFAISTILTRHDWNRWFLTDLPVVTMPTSWLNLEDNLRGWENATTFGAAVAVSGECYRYLFMGTQLHDTPLHAYENKHVFR